MFNRKYIFFLLSIILLTILRLFFISNTMLVDDEAYYAIYARHLALGYIDHGPVIAYMIYFFTILIENSLLGDKSIIMAGQIYEQVYNDNEKAMEYYMRIINNHTNSIYFEPVRYHIRMLNNS